MTSTPVIRHETEITPSWLSRVLGHSVESVHITQGHGNWSRQLAIVARLADGTQRQLRLKICLGSDFGRSEVDYYTRDYVDMADAPLVRCFAAAYDPAIGYHLLLEDLAATHSDRRDVPPTLAYGLTVAAALGRLHRHHWASSPAPSDEVLDRYFGAIRPGLVPMEQAISQTLLAGFERHAEALRRRWAEPRGMSLLHGDLNPTNILTPTGDDTSAYFLDRQPFNWSLTYGLAVFDLVYFMIPWWPESVRRECEWKVLRRWYEALERPEYAWDEAQADWRLSVEQCLHVPIEWCSKESTRESMRWLWQMQLERIQSAIRDGDT